MTKFCSEGVNVLIASGCAGGGNSVSGGVAAVADQPFAAFGVTTVGR